jgi:hypothetical protein
MKNLLSLITVVAMLCTMFFTVGGATSNDNIEELTIFDALDVVKYLVGMEAPCSDELDFDKNGVVDIFDALFVLKDLIGMNDLPVDDNSPTKWYCIVGEECLYNAGSGVHPGDKCVYVCAECRLHLTQKSHDCEGVQKVDFSVLERTDLYESDLIELINLHENSKRLNLGSHGVFTVKSFSELDYIVSEIEKSGNNPLLNEVFFDNHALVVIYKGWQNVIGNTIIDSLVRSQEYLIVDTTSTYNVCEFNAKNSITGSSEQRWFYERIIISVPKESVADIDNSVKRTVRDKGTGSESTLVEPYWNRILNTNITAICECGGCYWKCLDCGSSDCTDMNHRENDCNCIWYGESKIICGNKRCQFNPTQ